MTIEETKVGPKNTSAPPGFCPWGEVKCDSECLPGSTCKLDRPARELLPGFFGSRGYEGMWNGHTYSGSTKESSEDAERFRIRRGHWPRTDDETHRRAHVTRYRRICSVLGVTRVGTKRCQRVPISVESVDVSICGPGVKSHPTMLNGIGWRCVLGIIRGRVTWRKKRIEAEPYDSPGK